MVVIFSYITNLVFFIRSLKGRCQLAMATDFVVKSPNDRRLSHWHFETDWNIALWMSGLYIDDRSILCKNLVYCQSISPRD